MKSVYLIRVPSGYYKIGIAENVRRRLINLQSSNPEPIDLVCAVAVDDARRLEAYLHSTLSKQRGSGGAEWFKLTDSQAMCVAVRMNKPVPVQLKTPKPAEGDIDTRALQIFREHGRVSTSLLQRKLGIGYARAARAVDRLEEQGLVVRTTSLLARVLLD